MDQLSQHVKSADWKNEKHVPVIDCADQNKKDEMFDVTVTLGKEVSHPNTTEHHIRWIKLFFYPEGEQFPVQVGNFEFSAHGESTKGANEGSVYTHHQVTTLMKSSKSGVLHAMSYCNIHGLWESSKNIKII